MQSIIRNSVGGLLVLLAAASAQAQSTSCTQISTPPVSITQPGVYCLTADLSGIIWIGASDVVIDLQGHTVDGSAGGSGTTADGISAFDKQRITVRNGTVRGFRIGIFLGGGGDLTTSSHVIEGVRLDHNYVMGMNVVGRRSIVRNNVVTATGGAADTSPNGNGSPRAISVQGDLAQITDNIVMDTIEASASASSFGIQANGVGVLIERNTVRNSNPGPGDSTGILAGFRGVVVDNRVLNARTGIWLSDFAIYKDNIVGHATTPFKGPNAAAVGTSNAGFTF